MRRLLFLPLLAILQQGMVSCNESYASNSPQYVCMPCNNPCDEQVYDKPGTCKSCGMELIQQKELAYDDLDFKALCTLLNTKKLVILDVRSAGEFNGTRGKNYGHLKNAINIPIDELSGKLNSLKDKKDQPVLVYCSHGVRSVRAAVLLNKAGFKHIYNMKEGISRWKGKAQCDEWVVNK